jgi:hypothetical protein
MLPERVSFRVFWFGGVMQTLLSGAIMIGFGLVYVWKPNLFRRGIWMKTSIAIRFLSEENYKKYMRGLGVALVTIGLALVLFALSRYLGGHY